MALDEDLSSPEEEAPPVKNVLVPEEAPPIKTTPLVPETTPPVKKQPKPLKLANEIVLTESEEESDEPTVPEDEDVDVEELTKKEPPSEKKIQTFNNVPLENLFEVPQKKATKKKSKKPAEVVAKSLQVEPEAKPPKKSSGLLLEFSPSPTPASKPDPPAAESPVVKSERRDSKRKKSKKKKETEVVKSGGVSEGGAKETSGDPFGAIASLDAWLNSDSTGKVPSGCGLCSVQVCMLHVNVEDLVRSYLHNSFLLTHECQPLLLTFTHTRHVYMCKVCTSK